MGSTLCAVLLVFDVCSRNVRGLGSPVLKGTWKCPIRALLFLFGYLVFKSVLFDSYSVFHSVYFIFHPRLSA